MQALMWMEMIKARTLTDSKSQSFSDVAHLFFHATALIYFVEALLLPDFTDVSCRGENIHRAKFVGYSHYQIIHRLNINVVAPLFIT